MSSSDTGRSVYRRTLRRLRIASSASMERSSRHRLRDGSHPTHDGLRHASHGLDGRPILGRRVSDAADLREQLANLPTGPGVYIYRDASDRVLYVGKAKSIRKRVLSYFQAPLRPDEGAKRRRMTARGGLHPKIDELVGRIARVDTFVTGSESEALILEANLVKTHRPPFNVRLRDDKSYPYIGISLDEEYPRVYFTREAHRRDRLYFGPFSNAYKVRDTLNLINKVFPSRPCEGREPGRPSGVPCLDYHIKRCLAPCVGYISKEDYRALIDQIIAFLSGRYRGLEKELEGEMREAAAAQEFERAASLRNRLQAMRHLMERQFATAGSVGTADVLGVALEGDTANVQVLQVRDGVRAGPPVVLPRRRRRGGRGDGAGAVRVRVLRDGAGDPVAGDRGPGQRGGRRPRGAPHRPQGQPGGGARRRPGRQAQDGRAGDAQRPLRPGAGRAPPRAGARTPPRRARRPPGPPGPAGPAGADRVLRHLEPGRDLRGRVDGGLRGRGARQVALPHVHDALRRRPRRLRPHGGGHHPALLPDARPRRATPRSRRGRGWW